MNQLKALQGKDSVQFRRLVDRVEDWKRFHDRNRIQVAQFGMSRRTPMQKSGDQLFGKKLAKEGLTGDDAPLSSAKFKSNPSEIPQMALVDVVIIRSEERRTTNKGVNLMNGLSLIMTGNLFDFQRNRTSTAGTPTTDTEQKNANLKISLPSGGITYNLNIFNDNDDRNEVLARPTLVALDGQASDFFFRVRISYPTQRGGRQSGESRRRACGNQTFHPPAIYK